MSAFRLLISCMDYARISRVSSVIQILLVATKPTPNPPACSLAWSFLGHIATYTWFEPSGCSWLPAFCPPVPGLLCSFLAKDTMTEQGLLKYLVQLHVAHYLLPQPHHMAPVQSLTACALPSTLQLKSDIEESSIVDTLIQTIAAAHMSQL